VSPFLAARSCVVALLGPPDFERPRTDSPIARLRPAGARWGRYEDASLTLTDGADDLVATLRAERPNGDFREWQSIGEHTVRDACAWLGWEVPRPSPLGYDGDGRLATDDGDGVLFNDLPVEAA
jgi:hypothetical protein